MIGLELVKCEKCGGAVFIVEPPANKKYFKMGCFNCVLKTALAEHGIDTAQTMARNWLPVLTDINILQEGGDDAKRTSR